MTTVFAADLRKRDVRDIMLTHENETRGLDLGRFDSYDVSVGIQE